MPNPSFHQLIKLDDRQHQRQLASLLTHAGKHRQQVWKALFVRQR